jgi:predicted permease
MDKALPLIIGVLFGAALILLGIFRPSFAWNHEVVTSVRYTVGDTIMSIILVVAGIATTFTTFFAKKRR